MTALSPPALFKSLGDLSAGQMILLLQIAATHEATKAAAMLADSIGCLIEPSQQNRLTLVMRGLAHREADRYVLTTRGKWIGSAIIAETRRRRR